MRRLLFAAFAALLLVLVPVASASASTAKVAVGNSADGSILVDGHGKSLYMFGADHGRKSSCKGACATNWPPLLTTKAPKAGAGVSARKLSTTKRSDGKTQVTYAGHPLYGFVGDGARGDINGQGLNAFGGLWSLLAPSGSKISASGSSGSPQPAPSPSPSPNYPY
jgi:predicted lipoprotein with Yx(FWY)xxD motif